MPVDALIGSGVRVHPVQMGGPGYEQWLGPILDDPEPEIMADAEIDMRRVVQQDPDKRWWLAVDDGGQVLAWCAAWALTGQTAQEVTADLECGHNYERRGRGRQIGAYRLVFAARQHWIDVGQYSCVTHLFDQPVALHEAAGWVRVKPYDPADVGAYGHHWQRLIYTPDDLFPAGRVPPPGFVFCGTLAGTRQHLARRDRLTAMVESCGRRGVALCGRRVGDQDDIDWQRKRAGREAVELTGLLACGGCVQSHANLSDDALLKIADLDL